MAHVELIMSLLTWPFWCHNSQSLPFSSLRLTLHSEGKRFCRQQNQFVCLAAPTETRRGGGGFGKSVGVNVF